MIDPTGALKMGVLQRIGFDVKERVEKERQQDETV